jgi:hypothetical protein
MADPFVLSNDFRGGRSKDVPAFLRETHCAEAVNIDFFYARCGNKRWGSQLQFTGAFGGDGNTPWGSLIRHQPGTDESQAELWAFNHGPSPGQVQRVVAIGAPTGIVLPDPINTTLPLKAAGAEVRGATFNGKLFLAYDSPVDRLHVWDGTTVRRVGIAQTPPPTFNSVGAGALTDTRNYKAAFTKQVGGITVARSELSDFSGIHTMVAQYCAMNRPALLNEGETHWELYAFSDDDAYGTGYLIVTSPIAAVSAVDNLTPLVGDPPPEIGLNTPPISWKYLMVHGNRLLGAGSWEASQPNNRVWFTAPLGSGDQPNDDERVPVTLAAQNFVDLDENDGGFIVGFGGVINGSPVVVKSNGVHRLIPTGNAATPYQVAATPISRTVGGIRQEAIVQAEDEAGNVALYWLARTGPYRYSPTRGVEYCGYDIEDVWETTRAGDGYGQPHGVWYAAKKQVWFHVAISTPGWPRSATHRLVLHTQSCRSTGQGARGGWVRHDGSVCTALASVLYVTPTAAANGSPLRPYTSYGLYAVPIPIVGGFTRAAIVSHDLAGLLTDLGTDTYRSYLYSPAYLLGGLANRFSTLEPLFLVRREVAGAFQESTFGATLLRDFSEEQLFDRITQPSDSAAATTRFQIRRMATSMTGAHAVQVILGDAGVRNSPPYDAWWGIEAVMIERSDPNERA